MQIPSTKCANCWKEPALCLCDEIKPLQTRTRVLILQHPQESRNRLSTARLVSLSIPGAVHRVGFSWRSLTHALGGIANPKNWGVLYVGTVKGSQEKHVRLSKGSLDGIILLDGNWKQSKTLWWRNPWLLRLNRIVLDPKSASMYGNIRKEPRKNCISTIEAAAQSFSELGEPAAVSEGLRLLFSKHLDGLLANGNNRLGMPSLLQESAGLSESTNP